MYNRGGERGKRGEVVMHINFFNLKITHPPGQIYPIINFEIFRVMPLEKYFRLGDVVVEVLAFDVWAGRIQGSGRIIKGEEDGFVCQ